MLATPAKIEVVKALDARAETASPRPLEEGDELQPARGIALGMALGLVSIGLVALLAWWAF